MHMRATVLLGLLFALALAPISLAQAVIAGGLVFLTVLADRLFISRREVIGVVLAAAGLAILAATLDGGGDSAQTGTPPMTTAAANISTILAGPVVFDEPLTDDAGGVTLRVVAFGLVIVAATMTPPPAATERR